MRTRSNTDLAGDVLRPGDEGYAEASRTVFAGGRPTLVVRPRDTAGVASAIRYAAVRDLPLSVRSGGHSPLGHSTNNDGVVLDLHHLDSVEVATGHDRLVRIGGGATWGHVADTLGQHGLGLTSGDTSSVGVGGLTLGGGIGWMVRKRGLAIDNLVAARVVTAEGRVLDASEDENADLFWALRGGGGNFGVVVRFDFVAHPVAEVHFGAIGYQVDDPTQVVEGWRDHMRAAPEELSSTLVLMPASPGTPPSVRVLLCYAGDDPDAAVRAIEPLSGLGKVVESNLSKVPYADVLEDAHHPPGLRVLARNTFVPSLDDDVVSAIAASSRSERPTVLSIRSLGGAFARVAPQATAFAHRSAEALVVCGVLVPEAAGDAEVEEALRPWRTVAARGTGLYVNFQGSATRADIAAAYPPVTYARLSAVKQAYDPGNLFGRNHNIVPEQSARKEGPAA